MSDQKPSIGRIVHYVSYGSPGGEFSECRAAIITEVSDAEHIDAPLADGGCPHDEPGNYPNGAPGCWHWPERV